MLSYSCSACKLELLIHERLLIAQLKPSLNENVSSSIFPGDVALAIVMIAERGETIELYVNWNAIR